MLDLEQVRQILGPDGPQSEEALEAAREQAYALANLLLEVIRKTKRDK